MEKQQEPKWLRDLRDRAFADDDSDLRQLLDEFDRLRSKSTALTDEMLDKRLSLKIMRCGLYPPQIYLNDHRIAGDKPIGTMELQYRYIGSRGVTLRDLIRAQPKESYEALGFTQFGKRLVDD